MLAELPKLLDRNFAIAFFLPSAALMLSCWGVLQVFDQGAAVETFLKRDALVGAILGLVLVWLLALFLLALNYPVLRLYEGYYGRDHVLRWRRDQKRERFRRDVVPVLEIQDNVDAARARGEDLPASPRNHAGLLHKAISEFPDHAEFVLPTWFGNLFRGFEVYPRIVYGLDAIPAWPRLRRSCLSTPARCLPIPRHNSIFALTWFRWLARRAALYWACCGGVATASTLDAGHRRDRRFWWLLACRQRSHELR